MICPNSGDIFIQDSERSMLKTHWRLLALIQEIPLIYMGGVWIQRIEIDHNQAMTKDLSPLTTFPSSDFWMRSTRTMGRLSTVEDKKRGKFCFLHL